MSNILITIEDMIDELETALNTLPRVNATKIGLDTRADNVWVDTENQLIITNNSQSIDYYGGFEYVDSYARTSFGDYTIYDGNEDDRVQSAIEYYKQVGL